MNVETNSVTNDGRCQIQFLGRVGPMGPRGQWAPGPVGLGVHGPRRTWVHGPLGPWANLFILIKFVNTIFLFFLPVRGKDIFANNPGHNTTVSSVNCSIFRGKSDLHNFGLSARWQCVSGTRSPFWLTVWTWCCFFFLHVLYVYAQILVSPTMGCFCAFVCTVCHIQ